MGCESRKIPGKILKAEPSAISSYFSIMPPFRADFQTTVKLPGSCLFSKKGLKTVPDNHRPISKKCPRRSKLERENHEESERKLRSETAS